MFAPPSEYFSLVFKLYYMYIHLGLCYDGRFS